MLIVDRKNLRYICTCALASAERYRKKDDSMVLIQYLSQYHGINDYHYCIYTVKPKIIISMAT